MYVSRITRDGIIHKSSRNMGNFVIGAGLALIVFLFGWVSNKDYETALLDEAIYIKLVCDGTYPDYKNLTPECSKN